MTTQRPRSLLECPHRALLRGAWRHLVVLALGLGGFTGGGCLFLWNLNQDPDGLPCAPNTAQPCLEGYTCVEDAASGERLCRRAAIGEEGQECSADSECGDALVCRDITESCAEGDTDLNCQITPPAGRRCRRACNPALASAAQCSAGERCYSTGVGDAVAGFCQSGTCEVSSQCGANAANAVANECVNAANPPGASGLCALGCNPLQCNINAGCAGCPVGQESCEPPPGSGLSPFICVPPGGAGYGEACDNVNVYCAPGAFCLATPAGTAYCAQYCNAQGGAPACEGGLRCTPIPNAVDPRIGYCG